MHQKDFMDHVCRMRGVVRFEQLRRSIVERICDIENGMSVTGSGMPIDNVGISTCASKKDVFVLISDPSFENSCEITMEYVDDRGVVIGHDVPHRMKARYASDPDILWLGDNFVLFPNKIGDSNAKLIMKAVRFDAGLLDGLDPWMFAPCIESAQVLKNELGIDDPDLAAVIVGVDGLGSCGSVPMADVMEVSGSGSGHGESSSQHTFYRRYLVGEPLEIL